MMMRKKRKANYTICIYCEGSNTEPNYFERIDNLKINYGYALEIIIFDTDKSDPFGLVNEAISVVDEFNEVWVVFDKDGHPKLDEVFEKKKYKKIKKAFSSISFEQWILLHFEKSSYGFLKSVDIEDRLRDKTYLPKYCKSNEYDLYPKISAYTEIAFENSAWLKREKSTDLRSEKNKIYKINPYTDVDILVSKLLNIPYRILWFKFSDEIKFDKLILTMKSIKIFNNHSTLTFSIQNHKSIQQVYNNVTVAYLRESTDVSNIINYITIKKPVLINPDEIKTVSYKFPRINSAKNYNFIIVQNNIKVIIELDLK